MHNMQASGIGCQLDDKLVDMKLKGELVLALCLGGQSNGQHIYKNTLTCLSNRVRIY